MLLLTIVDFTFRSYVQVVSIGHRLRVMLMEQMTGMDTTFGIHDTAEIGMRRVSEKRLSEHWSEKSTGTECKMHRLHIRAAVAGPETKTNHITTCVWSQSVSIW